MKSLAKEYEWFRFDSAITNKRQSYRDGGYDFKNYLEQQLKARLEELIKELHKEMHNFPDQMKCQFLRGRIAQIKEMLGDEK